MTTKAKIIRGVSTALMAVAALGATAGAFAATNPTQGQSDLFLAVWNNQTDESDVVDMGSAWSYGSLSTTLDQANENTSFNLGSSLSSLLGASTSGYSYQLFAGDDVTGTKAGHTYVGNGAFLSLATGNAVPTTMSNGELISDINSSGTITTYLSSFLPGTTTSFIGTTTGTGGNSWDANSLSPGANYAFQNNSLNDIGGANVGTALELVEYVAAGKNSAIGTPTTSTVGNGTSIGMFNLSAAGLLTYSDGTASTVPLPPAGWLLISGLLGLLAVSRRRGGAEAI